MAGIRRLERASRWGALFAFGVLFFSTNLARATECGSERSDEVVVVDYVYDGDTVRLADGRKLRFIGINTPELNHGGRLSEPYAVAARKRVESLLGRQKRILLRYGRKRTDHYGRLLAHPYLEDGRSINVMLLGEGLGTVSVVPPNTWGYACYRGAEERARKQGLGLWALPRYQVTEAASLRQGSEGYRLVGGTVRQVSRSRRSVWLELEGKVSLRIPLDDLHFFAQWDLDALTGGRVTARGWLHFDQGRWRMTIRHPSALSRE